MGNRNDYKEERFDSYLNKIIIFTSKRYFKKQMSISNKEKTIVDDDDNASFLQDFLMINCAYSAVDDVERKLQLNTALKSLSAIEQAVVFLLYKKELNQDEASKILEICSKSVSRIKIRAIKKLKNFLKGDYNNEK